ncbi:uncharacterized protein LOC111592589 [Drosophila hydei]|uniref:Uncharacterized protein LOC111592589 n=1 Tax=Drosophila hydei TaxID=7224 RepID=A0A6J1LBL7_DROHY|nr:uncharacterized protein LOC111592589 [Drosophila hydei]
MSDPPRGLPQSLLSFYLQLFGAASAYIVSAVLMLQVVYLSYYQTTERNGLVALLLYVTGLICLCIYVNILWLRRKYPHNWVICSTIAALLGLGNAFLLTGQDSEKLLGVLEVIALMCIYLSMGVWLPKRLTPVRYVTAVFVMVVVLTVGALLLLWNFSDQHTDLILYSVHGILIIVMCPLMIFQMQVFSGIIWDFAPILDIPLCSVILLIDFLACYSFVDADVDIARTLELLSERNRRMFNQMSNM